jgi:hypothetical protein
VIKLVFRCRLIALLATLVAQAGCYYQVVDPQSGSIYYTQKWVAANGYHGPLTFTDHTGKTVSLRASRVSRIPRNDFLDATGQPRDTTTDSKEADH